MGGGGWVYFMRVEMSRVTPFGKSVSLSTFIGHFYCNGCSRRTYLRNCVRGKLFITFYDYIARIIHHDINISMHLFLGIMYHTVGHSCVMFYVNRNFRKISRPNDVEFHQ